MCSLTPAATSPEREGAAGAPMASTGHSRRHEAPLSRAAARRASRSAATAGRT